MPLPSFLIVGAQKGGTIAAAVNLSKHPEVSVGVRPVPPSGVECHFYDRPEEWALGKEWYAYQFITNKRLIGDDNPDLLHQHDMHLRVKETIPNAKIIVLLRNPLTRAYSQWNHWANGTEPNEPWRDKWLGTTFLEAWRKFPEMAWRGHYAAHLRSLAHLFGRESVYVGISERILLDLHEGYGSILKFLGVKPLRQVHYRLSHVRSYTTSMEPEEIARLQDYYKVPNQDLFDYLGYEVTEWK